MRSLAVLAVMLGASLHALHALQLPEKRAEMAVAPFVLGSRYGRSETPQRALAPRNDRFFMGSRYGKRSEGPSPASLLTPAKLLNGRDALVCEFTGLASLYRCVRREPTPPFRRGEDESAGDEE